MKGDKKRKYTNPEVETRGRKPSYPEGTEIAIIPVRVPVALKAEFNERKDEILEEFRQRIWDAVGKQIPVKALDPYFKPTAVIKYNSKGTLMQKWEKADRGEILEEWRPVETDDTL